MSGEQLLGIAAIITAFGTFATSIAALYVAIQTKKEVVTGNEQTLGQLGMRQETRRSEAIPHDDRTAQEQRHVDNDPLSKQENGG